MPQPGPPRTFAVALLVALPLAVPSAWLVVHSGSRVAELRETLAQTESAGQDASAAVGRLEPHAVEDQLAAFDRRRAVARELVRARRNRVIGVIGVAAAALAFGAVTVARRISAELQGDG
jgi:hypothetical protein